MSELINIAKKAQKAASELVTLSTEKKNHALKLIAENIDKNRNAILTENKKDLDMAKENGINDVMIDRLILNDSRIDGIISGIYDVIKLKDPIGQINDMNKMPNGLLVGKMRVPFGVIGVIYESRPNVTVEIAILTFKTSNAVILRGGKEAINSNVILTEVIQEALKNAEINEDCIQILKDTKRETAVEMMKLKGYIDLLIPRGNVGLIQSVVENATIPVVETGTGNCHIYVDDQCDLNMADEVLYNAKTSRPSVCNSVENLLVHKDVAELFLPMAKKSLKQKNVELRGCEKTQKIIDCKLATDEDYYTEFNDYILSIKIVNNLDEAIEHINKYSSKHSEAIITSNYANSQKFLQKIDSAAVYINASTRFTDGGEFGLGAEIGVSTQKMHARGPMGLLAMTSEKFVIYGNGQIR